MIIGNHELKGKTEVLKQPLCVLERRRTATAQDTVAVASSNVSSLVHPMEDTEGEDQSCCSVTTTDTTYYVIKGMITRKLLFQQYPRTILRGAAPTATTKTMPAQPTYSY